MDKSTAVAIFGRTQADLARALGVTRQCVWNWGEVLTQEQADRVRGAAVRLGKPLPQPVVAKTEATGARAQGASPEAAA
jgi:hypothetical protein